jgi:hypothetical protein
MGTRGAVAQDPLRGRILPVVETFADRSAPTVYPRVGADRTRGVSAAGGQSGPEGDISSYIDTAHDGTGAVEVRYSSCVWKEMS